MAVAQTLQPETFAPLRGSVVRVEADRERGDLVLGTGITVAPGIVVTNCHVTRDATTIRISGGGSLWGVTGQYADGNHDLCFLRAPGWLGSPVVMNERDSLELGQAVAAIGFTGGTGMSLRFGSVRALHSFDGGRVIESDTAFTSGASGGGLFDATGALVGLLTFRSRRESGSYYSLPVRWIPTACPGTTNSPTSIRCTMQCRSGSVTARRCRISCALRHPDPASAAARRLDIRSGGLRCERDMRCCRSFARCHWRTAMTFRPGRGSSSC